MIHFKTNNITTIISILNYNTYQGFSEQSTEQPTEQITNKIQTDKNDKNAKNDKNVKNVKNVNNERRNNDYEHG